MTGRHESYSSSHFSLGLSNRGPLSSYCSMCFCACVNPYHIWVERRLQTHNSDALRDMPRDWLKFVPLDPSLFPLRWAVNQDRKSTEAALGESISLASTQTLSPAFQAGTLTGG